ncbi:MAG: mucoidy inhibitor MuiA family protein [Bacteroidetes bacterium]|nr:MAG: mucoidy inhibitor MuiA family protein [Bacteroidota bacterium]
MKRLSLYLMLVVLAAGSVRAQEVNLTANSEIQKVNLFLSGAQVIRTAQVSLPSGLSRVVISGLTGKLDPASIQVSPKNDLLILSVSSKSTTAVNTKKLPIIKMLKDTLATLRYSFAEEQNNEFVLKQQESLLLVNKELKGDKGVVLIDLEDALIIYQKQLTQIKKGQLDSKMRQAELELKIEETQNRLREFEYSNTQNEYEIVLTVSTKTAQRNASFEVSYFVQNASWMPVYDIRVNDLKSPVKLQYKARLYNTSGENWDNVNLHLSSGNPNLSGVPPELQPQRLIYTDAQKSSGKGVYNSYRGVDNNGYQEYEGQIVQKSKAKKNDLNINFEFEVNTKVRVPSDREGLLIDLAEHQLNGHYSYRTVPKKDVSAFLLTNITGWEDLSLLPGVANIYFESTYLGDTYIEPGITGDTLDISLGRDRGVVVERNKLPEFCTTNFSGSKKKEILVYEIVVKNVKKEAVSIQILDQVPLSTNKEIDVDVKDISGAEWNKETGELQWLKTIAPGETIKLRISYEVRFPKDKVLIGL